MPTDIENAQVSAVSVRREIERIAGQTMGMEDTGDLRTFLTVAARAVEVAEFLLEQARIAEKFWQVRKSHGM